MTWAIVAAMAAVLAAALMLLREERRHSAALRDELSAFMNARAALLGCAPPPPSVGPDITSEWTDPATGFLHTSDGRIFDAHGNELVAVRGEEQNA